MKVRFLPRLLLVAALISTSAHAHPGHNASSGDESAAYGLFHFLTHLDHIGPFIVLLLLVRIVLCRRNPSSPMR